MRLRARTIMVPCAAFAVRVRLSEDAGLTPIERIVLMAIGAGLDNVEALAETLALGQRLLLDLIYDFWHKDYILIDDERASVQLTPEVRSLYDADRLDELASAESSVELVSLVQELVSGAVLPNVARSAPPQGVDAMLVPTLMGGLELADIPKGALLTALAAATERQTRQSKRSQVVREAWIEPDQILSDVGGGRRAYLTLLVDVVQPPGSSALEFDIIDAPPDVSPVVRRSIERGLTRLARELPDQLFFKRLRQQLARSDDEGTVADTLARLQRAVADIEEVDPGVLLERHAAFVRLHEQVRLDLAERTAAEADVDVLLDHDAQEKVLERILNEARYQVVIGNPWIGFKALFAPRHGGSWFERFEEALARGVQLVLLWGISVGAELEPRVRIALDDLRARHHSRFVWSTRPSVLHAKFAVQDANAALVTSYNFFDPPERPARELGVRVAGTRPGGTTACVLELLRWARDAFPNYRQARQILVLTDELGVDEPAAWPVEPPEPPDLAAPEAVRLPAIRHWAAEWKGVAAELAARRDALVRGAELVVDRMHRDALARAVKHCERRLAVLSDGLSVDVVTDELVDELRQRLRAGAACTLLFRREGASDSTAGPAARLQPLAAEFPRAFVLTAGDSHAKLLLCDDEAVIGSFNFLSYGGDYDRRLRAERAELSVRVRNREVVQRIAEALGRHWPDAFAALARRDASFARPEPAPTLAPQLQPLFSALRDEPEPGALLLRWFAERPRPWADLDALCDAGVPEPLLARAVAATLASAAADEPDRRRWLWWMVDQRWCACDFLGSALLAPPAGTSPLGVDAPLARAAAAVEAPALASEALRLDAQQCAEHDEARTLLAIVDVLAHGRPPADARLLDPPQACAPHLQRWARAAAAFYAAASGPLPWHLLRRQAGAQAQQQACAAARDRFARALAAAEQIGFRFQLGQHTWEAMRAPDKPLGAMRAALVANDPAALQRYFAALDQTSRGLEAIMDALSERYRDAHSDRIGDPKRRVCLTRLGQVEDAAREWIACASVTPASAAETHLLNACRRLRAALADLAAPDTAALSPLAEPLRRFALTRVQVLFAAEVS